MKLCLSMWSFHRRFFGGTYTVLDFLGDCRERGIAHVELLDVFWRDMAAELPAVRAALADLGLTVGAYAVTNDFVSNDPAKREAALAAVVNGIKVAKSLGTNIVRVFAGDSKAGYDFVSGLGHVVDGLKRATAVAEREGVVLALENHGKLAGRSDQIREIIERVGSKSLGVTFDCGNFFLVGQSPLAAWDELASHVVHVHVKDLAPAQPGTGWASLDGKHYVGRACGQGAVPIRALLDRMREAGYRGSVSIEFEGEGDEAHGVNESVAYLAPQFAATR